MQASEYKPMGEVVFYNSTPSEYHSGQQSIKKLTKTNPQNKHIQKGDGTTNGSNFRRSESVGGKPV